MRGKTVNGDIEKIRVQLLNMMTASKQILDARHGSRASPSMDAAIAKLQHEYVQSIVLIKTLDNSNSKVPALLKSNHGALLEKQMFDFKESLAVSLDEE
jgi:hypothetical protein